MDKKIVDIYNNLFINFGYQNWWPIIENGKCNYLDEYRLRERTAEEILEITIGAILTQNTSWDNAAKAIAKMKAKGILRLDILAGFDEIELAYLIRESGYYNQKAKKIKALSYFYCNTLGKDILALKKYSLFDARKMLLSVWGIGKETADSILLYGYYFPIFIIDSYTRRIFSRIGVKSANAGYDILQSLIHSALVPDRLVYQEYHAGLVRLGKNICKRIPLCQECFISFMCCFAKRQTGYAHKCT